MVTSLSAFEVDKVLREGHYAVVTPALVARLFKITNQNTLYKWLQRLTAQRVLKRAGNGLYFVASTRPGTFFVANSLVTPSYVSLETALNFYGILPQFPYPVTSVTTKRNSTIIFDSREFVFRRLNSNLYFGFVKQDDYLIATPEKAVFDLLYFKSKGLARVAIDDWDISCINKNLLKKIAKKVNLSADKLL
jgi:predicted transcriptional regulator of viral defense system